MSNKSIGENTGAEPPARAYRSELRQRQAAETRLRIVAAAADLFATTGYARTTLASIGAAAGVSTETVQAQGAKAALMIAAVEFTAFGHTEEQNILDLDIGQRFLALTDRDEAIDLIVDEQTSIHERTAAISRALFGAAATDPQLDQYLTGLLASIGRQIRRLLEVCAQHGWLRDDVGFDELVETAVVISSTETYLRMVHHDGWNIDDYRAWFHRVLAEAVFGSTPSSR